MKDRDLILGSPTRKAITLAFKSRGSMTVEDLSGDIGVTLMCVRQHLLVLERTGIVEYTIKKHGAGRPGFLYRLTERAEDYLFPKIYADISLHLLEEIEERDGRRKIDELFRARKDNILCKKSKRYPRRTRLSDYMCDLVEMLSDEGEFVEIEEEIPKFRLKRFTCPMPKIAQRYEEACTYDVELFRGLLGEAVDIQLQKRIIEGAPCCEYLISEIS